MEGVVSYSGRLPFGSAAISNIELAADDEAIQHVFSAVSNRPDYL